MPYFRRRRPPAADQRQGGRTYTLDAMTGASAGQHAEQHLVASMASPRPAERTSSARWPSGRRSPRRRAWPPAGGRRRASGPRRGRAGHEQRAGTAATRAPGRRSRRPEARGTWRNPPARDVSRLHQAERLAGRATHCPETRMDTGVLTPPPGTRRLTASSARRSFRVRRSHDAKGDQGCFPDACAATAASVLNRLFRRIDQPVSRGCLCRAACTPPE